MHLLLSPLHPPTVRQLLPRRPLILASHPHSGNSLHLDNLRSVSNWDLPLARHRQPTLLANKLHLRSDSHHQLQHLLSPLSVSHHLANHHSDSHHSHNPHLRLDLPLHQPRCSLKLGSLLLTPHLLGSVWGVWYCWALEVRTDRVRIWRSAIYCAFAECTNISTCRR